MKWIKLLFDSRPGAAILMVTHLQTGVEVGETVFNMTIKHVFVTWGNFKFYGHSCRDKRTAITYSLANSTDHVKVVAHL